MKKSLIYLITTIFILFFPILAIPQQINLDRYVEAGGIIFFSDLNDPGKFFYLPQGARLATGKDGKFQFSFLRYVENVRTGSTQESQREGDGGGIVHAVVELGVSDEQLRTAQRELQRKVPNASIEGPVVFKSGRFGLVSSFREENGELTKKVLGLGSAPILEGSRAAISMRLTKMGATILWESFKMAAPDISFSFEMEVQGYRMPKRASIEADFDQINMHHSFQAGVASSFLAAEIKMAFDDLVKNGAIKVEQVGSDENMEALIATAYNKLTEMMFNPASGTGTPSMAQLTNLQRGQTSILDRAMQMLNRSGQGGSSSGSTAGGAGGSTTSPGRTAERATTTPGAETASTPAVTASGADTIPAQREVADTTRPTEGITEAAETADTTGTREATPAASAADTALTATAPASGTAAADAARPGRGGSSATTDQGSSWAILAAYELKREKKSGKFKIDLNKWTSDAITTRFDENIGNLSDFVNDPLYFRQVNLDDPLFRQREIVAFVDGYNAADFKKYINFVSVRLQKKHEKGDITHDEVRIDRYNFNDNGNYFKMLYGWKGDNNREKWMEYQYEVLWSFFGDNLIRENMKTTTFNTINLSPPLAVRAVELQADESLLKEAGVRLVTVNIYYKIGDKEFMEQGTLNPARGLLSEKVDYLAQYNDLKYEYEISWRLTGNKVIKTDRLTSSESILFVDELPDLKN